MIASQVRELRDATNRLIHEVQAHFDNPPDSRCGEAGEVPPCIVPSLQRAVGAVFAIDAEMARDGSGRFVQSRQSGRYPAAGAQTALAKALLTAVMHARDPLNIDPERDWEQASHNGMRCVETLKLAGVILRALQLVGVEVRRAG